MYLFRISPKPHNTSHARHSFVEEHGPAHRSRFDFRILGKAEGHKHDYDHTGMLIHKDAEGDHFPEVLEWVKLHD